jgi:hypothetical protein
VCKLVAVDWLKGKDKMDNVAGHPHSLVQKALFNGELFFFIFNLQVVHCLLPFLSLEAPRLNSEELSL